MHMHKFNGRKAKAAGFIGTVALTGGLLASAVVGTGAYFSDTQANNHITGTMGSIQIEGHDGSGTNNLDAVFTDMLPGEMNSKTLRYSNTGPTPGCLARVQGSGSGRRQRHVRHQLPRHLRARSTSPATALRSSPART